MAAGRPLDGHFLDLNLKCTYHVGKRGSVLGIVVRGGGCLFEESSGAELADGPAPAGHNYTSTNIW